MAMRKGDSGGGVRQLQNKLNEQLEERRGSGNDGGDLDLVVDGTYGDQTVYAVARFQSNNQLSPTGVADADTLSSMGLDSSLSADAPDVVESSGGGV